MNIIRRIHSFIRLLTPDIGDKTDGGYWIVDEGEAAFIDTDSGRLLAFVHDAFGKFYPSLYLSPFQAFRVSKLRPAVFYWLASFPRVRVDLLRLKANSMREAQNAIEALIERITNL